MFKSLYRLLLLFPFLVHTSAAIILNVTDYASIHAAAALTAHGVQELYNGNRSGGVRGKWPSPPYYWWESGGAWGGMMNYWAFSGDASYNDVMMDALVSQLGPAYDFVLERETTDEGNDDQAFWVFVAMSAAEYGFPPPPEPAPPWVTVVQNAWSDYVSRWDTKVCNGGLKWQFHPQNEGFYYRNSISNSAFFQISARLARFTGNQMYEDWANKIWDWMRGVALIDDFYNVFDGTDELINCSQVDHTQWTYNIGAMLYGAAIMSNHTNSSEIWVDRTVGLLAAVNAFVTPLPNATNIMFEAACELTVVCNVDQLSMKAYLARWLAGTSKVTPYTAGRIGQILRASALGAAAACTGGPYGNTCGFKWFIEAYDGSTGLGQELAAMDVITALLVNSTAAPTTLPNVTVPIYVPLPPSATMPDVADPGNTSTARPLFDGPRTAFAVKNSLPTLAVLLPVLAQLAR